MKLMDSDGIGFAIPINVVKDFLGAHGLDQLLPVARMRLGPTQALPGKGLRLRLPEGHEDLSPTRDSLVINVIGEAKWNEVRQQNEKNVLKTMQTRLKAFCDDVSSEFPACQFITDDIIVRIGLPVEEILAQVESGGYDLVVMGAHGRGVLSDTLMGSTSRRVLRRCKTPVLVIRLPEA